MSKINALRFSNTKNFTPFLVLFFILGIFILDVSAQSIKPIPCRENKHGFVNENGDTVIPCKYDEMRVEWNTINPLFIVGQNKKYGLLDGQGKEITPLKYDAISEYVNNLATVKLNGKYGLLDLEGNEVLPIDNDVIRTPWSSLVCYFFQKNNKWGVFDQKTKTVITAPIYDDIIRSRICDLSAVRIDEKYGIVSLNGKEMINVIYDFIDIWDANTILLKKDSLYGLSDADGKIRLPLKYQEILTESWYWSYQTKMNKNARLAVKENGRWGFLNPKNEYIASPKYERVGNFRYGLAKVYLNGKWEYINLSGKTAFPQQFAYADDFWRDFAIVSKDGLKYGFINIKGKSITEFKYDEAETMYHVARVAIDNKWGLIDKTGKEIVPLKYNSDEIDDEFYILNEDQILIKAENEVRLLDKNGNILVPLGYDKINYNEAEIKSFVEVWKGEKVGWYDIRLKKEIIPVIYDQVYLDMELDPYDRWVTLVKDGKFGVWDLKKQMEIVSPVYNSMEFMYDLTDFDSQAKIILVSLDGKKGWIDLNSGAEVIPIQFNEIFWDWDFRNFVFLNNNGKKGLSFFEFTKQGIISSLIIPAKYTNIMIDKSFYDNTENLVAQKLFVIFDGEQQGMWNTSLNREIIPPIYDNVYSFDHKIKGERYITAIKNRKLGVYNQNGTQLIPLEYDWVEPLMDGTNGYFLVSKNGILGLFDLNGKEILQCKYSDISVSKGKAKAVDSESGKTQEVLIKK